MGKMTAEEREKFHRKALEDQRHLLRTAIDGMAAGDLTQALHVATQIRVLVHETGASKPLLKHLHKNYLECRSSTGFQNRRQQHPWESGR